MSGLKLRVMTALSVGGLAIVTILFLPAVWTVLMLSLAVLMGAWEWSAFLGTRSTAIRGGYVVLIGALSACGWYLTVSPAAFMGLMYVSVGWWLLALLWLMLAPQRMLRGLSILAGVLALVPTWVALARIDVTWGREGSQWALFILVLAFTTDTGAFFAGRRFGRVRLAPQVSPNKTWEGVIGGVLLALLISALCAAWFGLPLWRLLLLGAAGAAFSVVGDLTESRFKRHAGLKDSGHLFPGHGGVLDRIDSVTAAVPVMTLGLIWLGIGV